MRFLTLALGSLPALAQCANIVLSNDDGWAEINIRAFYNDLTRAGNSVILSAPAENESGTGSSDAPATPLTKACEFNSCPAGSPAEGSDASNNRLNYVNSYPVTSMRYGIQTLSPQFFDGQPDLAVAGFNVGANLGSTTLISGTVGAATEAAKEGIPAIAFSGSTGSQIAYTTSPVPSYVTTYAALSTNVTQTLLASSKPYLPSNIWLNVNYPTSSSSSCSKPSDFNFVLSRINTAASGAAADVKTCGKSRLPTESAVVGTKGCYASISVGNAATKGDTTAANQAVVLGKLGHILSCLPA
ncbi:MAG: hypothetical protein Q9218_004012 [Villophora microphyllina]